MKKTNAMKSFFIAWMLVMFCGLTFARFHYYQAECPDKVEPGKVWFPKASCERCRCMENAYGCNDCEDDVPLSLMEGCYVVERKANNSLKYPGCCPNNTSVCQGDKNFDQQAFEKFTYAKKP